MKILIDMNLSPDWVSVFRSIDVYAIHWSSIGSADAKDPVIMRWALDNGHIVFTHDLDFGTALALSHGGGPSVLQLRSQEVMPTIMGDVVTRVVIRHQEELESGALVVVDENRSRVRILPIL